MKITVLVLLCALGATTFAVEDHSAQQVNLDSCLALAHANNLSLQSIQLESNLNRPALRAAWGQFLPTLTAGLSLAQTDAHGSSTDSRSSQFNFRLSEVLFDGGRNLNNLLNARLNNRYRIQQILQEELQLRVDVITAYCNAVAAEKTLELAVQSVSQRRLQLEYARIRFETGSVTRRDVMQAEVDLGRAITDSLSSSFGLVRAREALNIILGIPLDEMLNLADLPPIFALEWETDQLVKTALQHRPDLLGVQYYQNIRQNELKSARAAFLPRLTADLTHTKSDQTDINSSFNFLPDRQQTSLGLTLSWEVFNRFSQSLQYQTAKVRLSQTNLQLADLNREVQRQVSSSLNRLQALYEQSIVVNQYVRWAEETLNFEQERYRVGSASVIELSTAQVSYIQARNDQIRIASEFNIALGELERAVGTILRD